MEKLTPFTVFGVWEDDGLVFQKKVQACDEYRAMQCAANSVCGDGSDLCILGAVHGHVTLFTPGCDNMKSAYAVDLKGGA